MALPAGRRGVRPDQVKPDGTLNVQGSQYTLPVAGAETLGGVKVGSGLSITEAGVLSAAGYSLPQATSEVLGGVKVGSGLSITEAGVLSASGGGGLEVVSIADYDSGSDVSSSGIQTLVTTDTALTGTYLLVANMCLHTTGSITPKVYVNAELVSPDQSYSTDVAYEGDLSSGVWKTFPIIKCVTVSNAKVAIKIKLSNGCVVEIRGIRLIKLS